MQAMQSAFAVMNGNKADSKFCVGIGLVLRESPIARTERGSYKGQSGG